MKKQIYMSVAQDIKRDCLVVTAFVRHFRSPDNDDVLYKYCGAFSKENVTSIVERKQKENKRKAKYLNIYPLQNGTKLMMSRKNIQLLLLVNIKRPSSV